MLHKACNSKWEIPFSFPRSSIKFQGHTVQNITDFDPNWAFPVYRPVAAFNSLRFDLLSEICFVESEDMCMYIKCIHSVIYVSWGLQGGTSALKCRLASIEIPILKIRWYRDRIVLILYHGNLHTSEDGVYIDTGPRLSCLLGVWKLWSTWFSRVIHSIT